MGIRFSLRYISVKLGKKDNFHYDLTMRTSASATKGTPRPGAAKPGVSGMNTLRGSGSGKPAVKSRKLLKRPYKPLPTTRYLVAGLTAILLSMGLITGAMSAVSQFDTKPWAPEQELHWDPFQKNDIPGLDPGALNQSGRRTSDAIKRQTRQTTSEATDDTNSGNKSDTDTPRKSPDREANASQPPSQESPAPGATFEVPGAPQTPTASQPPAGGKPPLASGKSPVGHTGPKA
ncbi:hypothetical protein HHJ81_02475 [Mobiluncus mulieris]|nr:hypothetical protein [Mobiluncus mulieris]